jgi:hypothetical protein
MGLRQVRDHARRRNELQLAQIAWDMRWAVGPQLSQRRRNSAAIQARIPQAAGIIARDSLSSAILSRKLFIMSGYNTDNVYCRGVIGFMPNELRKSTSAPTISPHVRQTLPQQWRRSGADQVPARPFVDPDHQAQR